MTGLLSTDHALSRIGMPRNFALRAGEGETTLVCATHGAKLSNFGPCTCEHQNYLACDRWCSHVQHQSYVTLAPTSVGTNGHRRGALVPTRVDPKVT